MSYSQEPDLNPYAAPQSTIAPVAYAPTFIFYGWAGFWRRFVAIFIDGIVVLFVSMFVGGMIGGILGATGNLGPHGFPAGVRIVLRILGYAIGLLYFAGMESCPSQATFGKQALGIKVTDLHGRRLSFVQAVGRNLAKVLSYLILGIGFIMVAFTEKKQGLHDMIAGTLVIKAR